MAKTKQGEKVQKSGVKFSQGKKEGWGEGVLRLVLIYHYPILILICNKLVSLSRICIAHDDNS